MTKTANTTMAASKAANTSFKEVTCGKMSKCLKTMSEQKIVVKRTHVYMICITFPALSKNKFNPLTSTRTFFKAMLKYDSTITIIIPNDTKQISLSTDVIPATEEEFTKFFYSCNRNTHDQ